MWLQWGQRLSALDTRRPRLLGVFHLQASMGPTPFSVGYRGAARQLPPVRQASMGPTPFSVGYRKVLARRGGCQVPASMGPTPFSVGYGAGFRRGADGWLWASMGPTPFSVGYDEGEKYGQRDFHRFNGANAFQRWIRASGNHPRDDGSDASMGPTPFSVGYAHRQPVVPRARAASMGPTPFSVGYLICCHTIRSTRICFNGANAFQRWIQFSILMGTNPS